MEYHAGSILGTLYAGILAPEILGKATYVAGSLPLRHGQVMEQIIATGGRGGARYLVGIVHHIPEGTQHEVAHRLTWPFAFHYQIIACEATHGSPVDDAVFPLGVVTQERGHYVLYRMDGRGMQEGSRLGAVMRMS